MAAAKAVAKKHSVTLTVLLIALVIYFVVSIISNQSKVHAQELVNAQKAQQLQEQLAENEELSGMVGSENEDEYMERKAREDGFAKPDERVYVDSAAS